MLFIVFILFSLDMMVYLRPSANVHYSKLDIIREQQGALPQLVIGGSIGLAIGLGTGFAGSKIIRIKWLKNGSIRFLFRAAAVIIPLVAGYLTVEGYRASSAAWSNQTLLLLRTILPFNSSLYTCYLLGSLLDEGTASIKNTIP